MPLDKKLECSFLSIVVRVRCPHRERKQERPTSQHTFWNIPEKNISGACAIFIGVPIRLLKLHVSLNFQTSSRHTDGILYVTCWIQLYRYPASWIPPDWRRYVTIYLVNIEMSEWSRFDIVFNIKVSIYNGSPAGLSLSTHKQQPHTTITFGRIISYTYR